jgi:NAD(P)-dependent dehydrogenase (short-subunit alcohol dehydrogenase family)
VPYNLEVLKGVHMPADFTGKTVIVTGGAKGIGRGIVEAFSAAGANVVAADVDAAAGVRLEAECANQAGNVTFVEADVSQAARCKSLVQHAVDSFGGVNILCNNVGIQPADSYLPAHELPEALWDAIIAVNLKSSFLMSKFAIPVMKTQGGGVIVNTASVQGLQTAYGVSAYAASKGGLLMLTKQLALEYARDNIRVLAVNPGTIETPLVAQAAQGTNQPYDDLKAQWAEAHPIGRIGQPRDIANAVLFLASDEASFMTGEYINVDGGMMTKGAWA